MASGRPWSAQADASPVPSLLRDEVDGPTAYVGSTDFCRIGPDLVGEGRVRATAGDMTI